VANLLLKPPSQIVIFPLEVTEQNSVLLSSELTLSSGGFHFDMSIINVEISKHCGIMFKINILNPKI